MLKVLLLLAIVTLGSAGPHYRRACEHNRMSLACPGKIHIVKASYGRHAGKGVCGHPSIRTTNCHAGSSLAKVRAACEGKTRCSLWASNRVFGDPCVGTYKYLEVTYTCPDMCTSRPTAIGGTFSTATCKTPAQPGTKCTPTCKTGYVPSGSTTCYKRRWTTVRCHKKKPNDCLKQPMMKDKNGNWTQVCKDIASGNTCSYGCARGYTVAASVKCNNGAWVYPTGQWCKPAMCAGAPPQAANAMPWPASCKNKPSGSTCPVTCKKGYKSGGNAECTNGQWSSPNCNPDLVPYDIHCLCQAAKCDQFSRFGPKCKSVGSVGLLGSFSDTRVNPSQFDFEFGAGNWAWAKGGTQVVTNDGKWVCTLKKPP